MPDNWPMSTFDHLMRSLSHTLVATVFVLCHTAVSMIIIGCLLVVEAIFVSHHDPKAFDLIPWRWVFDAMDFAIIGAYMYRGVRAALETFREG